MRQHLSIFVAVILGLSSPSIAAPTIEHPRFSKARKTATSIASTVPTAAIDIQGRHSTPLDTNTVSIATTLSSHDGYLKGRRDACTVVGAAAIIAPANVKAILPPPTATDFDVIDSSNVNIRAPQDPPILVLPTASLLGTGTNTLAIPAASSSGARGLENDGFLIDEPADFGHGPVVSGQGFAIDGAPISSSTVEYLEDGRIPHDRGSALPVTSPTFTHQYATTETKSIKIRTLSQLPRTLAIDITRGCSFRLHEYPNTANIVGQVSTTSGSGFLLNGSSLYNSDYKNCRINPTTRGLSCDHQVPSTRFSVDRERHLMHDGNEKWLKCKVPCAANDDSCVNFFSDNKTDKSGCKPILLKVDDSKCIVTARTDEDYKLPLYEEHATLTSRTEDDLTQVGLSQGVAEGDCVSWMASGSPTMTKIRADEIRAEVPPGISLHTIFVPKEPNAFPTTVAASTGDIVGPIPTDFQALKARTEMAHAISAYTKTVLAPQLAFSILSGITHTKVHRDVEIDDDVVQDEGYLATGQQKTLVSRAEAVVSVGIGHKCDKKHKCDTGLWCRAFAYQNPRLEPEMRCNRIRDGLSREEQATFVSPAEDDLYVGRDQYCNLGKVPCCDAELDNHLLGRHPRTFGCGPPSLHNDASNRDNEPSTPEVHETLVTRTETIGIGRYCNKKHGPRCGPGLVCKVHYTPRAPMWFCSPPLNDVVLKDETGISPNKGSLASRTESGRFGEYCTLHNGFFCGARLVCEVLPNDPGAGYCTHSPGPRSTALVSRAEPVGIGGRCIVGKGPLCMAGTDCVPTHENPIVWHCVTRLGPLAEHPVIPDGLSMPPPKARLDGMPLPPIDRASRSALAATSVVNSVDASELCNTIEGRFCGHGPLSGALARQHYARATREEDDGDKGLECRTEQCAPPGQNIASRDANIHTYRSGENASRQGSGGPGDPCVYGYVGCDDGLVCSRGECVFDRPPVGDYSITRHDVLLSRNKAELSLTGLDRIGKACNKDLGQKCVEGLERKSGKCTPKSWPPEEDDVLVACHETDISAADPSGLEEACSNTPFGSKCGTGFKCRGERCAQQLTPLKEDIVTRGEDYHRPPGGLGMSCNSMLHCKKSLLCKWGHCEKPGTTEDHGNRRFIARGYSVSDSEDRWA